jgi:hypothetical protein
MGERTAKVIGWAIGGVIYLAGSSALIWLIVVKWFHLIKTRGGFVLALILWIVATLIGVGIEHFLRADRL